MTLTDLLRQSVKQAFAEIYHADIELSSVQIEETEPFYEGDITIVLFNLLRFSRKSPKLTAEETGNYLKDKYEFIEKFMVIKGFLNLTIRDKFWVEHLEKIRIQKGITFIPTDNPVKYLIEFSSPNTNKPLHLGHIRNNLLGQSLSELLKKRGHHVIRVNLVNDRGIHICKSMLAWMKDPDRLTPESSGMKGDHLVGEYYVRFDRMYREEVEQLVKNGMDRETAENNSKVMMEARELLRKWENNDPEVRNVWKMMNSWVYKGFEETYQRLGINFDKIYYESDTYLLGKEIVAKGLEKGIFYRKEDNSVWINLTDDGFDEKLLLRADGTSVYITQDLGTAELRYQEFKPDKMVYVVGNEQEYHFNVLRKVCEKLEKQYAQTIYHLSYGMVDLPEGKMKSREGTVVDADDLMEEMKKTAMQYMADSGKAAEIDQQEQQYLSEIIGQAALKYFILKTDSRKRILFDPKESIDFQGNTGPFVQYTYARIRSVFRKGNILNPFDYQLNMPSELTAEERDLLKKLYFINQVMEIAEQRMDTSVIAAYLYQIAKTYNKFYHECQILNEPDPSKRSFRIVLSAAVENSLLHLSRILGIDMPERM